MSRCQDQPLHAHENEEWYQKWLRRQRNQPSHVVEIGAANVSTNHIKPQLSWEVFHLLLTWAGSMIMLVLATRGPQMSTDDT